MQENPEIACGFLKEYVKNSTILIKSRSRNNVSRHVCVCILYNSLTFRFGLTWQHRKGTGGGLNWEYRFSATEESIYNLITMKTSVEGVPGNGFGLGSGKQNEDPLNKTFESLCVNVVVTEENKNDSVEGVSAPKSARMCSTPKEQHQSL